MAITVGEIAVKTLIANNIDQLYCLPGVQNDDFFDVLYDNTKNIKPIHARHEQGAAYMALGAAMATGKPQVFSIVPGPGFLNSTAALSTAYAVNAPVFALIGQIPLGAIGKGYGLLHEIPDQLSVIKSLTKKANRIENTESASKILTDAFSSLQSGRPRPVGVEIPVNIWNSKVDKIPQDLVGYPESSPILNTDQIEEAAALLNKSHKPIIIVGGGAQNFSVEVNQLSKSLSAPVIAFRNGHGIMDGSSQLSVTLPAGRELWGECDVVLAIGTRCQTAQMQWGVDDRMKIIHIDIDDEEIGRINTPEIGINADLKDALPSLLDNMSGKEKHRNDWVKKVNEVKLKYNKLFAEKLAPQIAWLAAIRAELPKNGIFVDELTQVGYVSRFAFESYSPRTFLSTGYQGTLGWGFASALGAAHARRDVPVVSISGDGGALYTISELATAARHNIPITAIIFNDNAFGNVRRFQIEKYNNRPIASDLKSPNFVKLAESFGVQGLKAKTPDELRNCLKKSFASGKPTVIEVPVGDFPSPWEFILMPKIRV
ncbi:MAG: thiamine pyrophosphate-binding protein [Paracoccaceae bacterium]|nr:thiamine pyrophosphate-binding protein [Paracoccaceae bacterium]